LVHVNAHSLEIYYSGMATHHLSVINESAIRTMQSHSAEWSPMTLSKIWQNAAQEA